MRTFVMFFASLAIAAAGLAHQKPDSLWSVWIDYGHIDELDEVIQTADCGYLAIGCSNVLTSPIYGTLFLMKTTNSGTIEWTKRYAHDAAGCAISPTSDGGYLATGYLNANNYSAFVLKISGSGDSLWSRQYGGPNLDLTVTMQATPDGNFALGGSTESYGQGYPNAPDYWLLRINGSGDSLWSKTYGGSGIDYCQTMARTPDGGYALAGYTNSFGSGGYDFWLVKTNSNGDSLWSRTYGTGYNEYCWGVIPTTDGGYMLVGYRYFAGGRCDAWLVKTNANGDSLWSRNYGGSQNEYAFSVVQTPDGGYVFGGSTWSFGYGSDDMWLVGVSANGDSLWSRTFGGTRWDEICRDVLQDSRGAILLAGWESSFSPTYSKDAWLVKTDFTRPHVSSITDVGNDQGRQVRIRWLRPSYDQGGACPTPYTITGYNIYRRIDLYRQSDATRAQRATLDWPPGEWEFIVSVPARGEVQYAVVAPTLADSTSEGIYQSVYFVSAETPDPLVYFDSDPDSGYSIDNLAPDETVLTAWFQPTPTGLLLQWESVTTGSGQPEQGNVWYRVYGSADADFAPGPGTLLHTTQQTEFQHATTAESFYYVVTASDDH